MKIKSVFIAILLTAAFSAPSFCQEKRLEEIPLEKLQETADEVVNLAKQTEELRKKMEGMETIDSLISVGMLQGQFNEIMVLIATTHAPKAGRAFALHVALAAKNIELSLWYFIAGTVENNAEYMSTGDALLKEGIKQLAEADKYPLVKDREKEEE